MSVIDLLLESEGHVPYEPGKHNKLHFQMCRLVKDEIREHKWIEGEKGRDLTWEEAVNEWMDKHYKAFIKAVVPLDVCVGDKWKKCWGLFQRS